MNGLDVTLEVPLKIAAGLASGELVREGGTVRDSSTKQIAALLRETGTSSVSQNIELLSSVAATAGVLNLAVSTMGFAVVMHRLGVVEQQLLNS